jgi:hypothetical protein
MATGNRGFGCVKLRVHQSYMEAGTATPSRSTRAQLRRRRHCRRTRRRQQRSDDHARVHARRQKRAWRYKKEKKAIADVVGDSRRLCGAHAGALAAAAAAASPEPPEAAPAPAPLPAAGSSAAVDCTTLASAERALDATCGRRRWGESGREEER